MTPGYIAEPGADSAVRRKPLTKNDPAGDEPDDTEGHGFKGGITDADTEGHGFRHVAEAGDESDAEGHGRRLPEASGDDDTEGHALKFRP